MNTINPNLSSLLSTAELRRLERRFDNPRTSEDGLILRGIQAQLEDNSRSNAGRSNAEEELEELRDALDSEIETNKTAADAEEALDIAKEVLREICELDCDESVQTAIEIARNYLEQ